MDRHLVAGELLRVARILLGGESDCPLCSTASERTADRWVKMPKGWTAESRRKFWDSLTGDVKHKTTKCIKRMAPHVTDPGAFCAALRDRIEGTTYWRGKK